MKKTMSAAALAAALLLSTAAPASASASACTHHWSGPQACIRLDGKNGWNRVTAIWVNPPKQVKARTVTMTLNGHRVFRDGMAHRVGDTLSYTWPASDLGTDTRVCVRFAGINRVACETTKYTGVPGAA